MVEVVLVFLAPLLLIALRLLELLLGSPALGMVSATGCSPAAVDRRMARKPTTRSGTATATKIRTGSTAAAYLPTALLRWRAARDARWSEKSRSERSFRRIPAT
jgi:hypothetical protein